MDERKKNWFDKMVTAAGVLLILSVSALVAINVVRGLVQP